MASSSSSAASQSSSPSLIDSMGRRIVKCLKPWIPLVGVHGWDGVGRQRVLRHAVEALQTGNDPNPYTRVLWLSAEEGVDHFLISKKIDEVLLTERDSEGRPFQLWWEPFSFPEYAILVVIDDLHHPISLQQVSRGRYPRLTWRVTIVFSSGDRDLVGSLESESSPTSWQLDSGEDAICIHEPLAGLSREQVCDLLWHEAAAAADELPRQDGVQLFSQDTVMECVLYCALFPGRFYAPNYWWSDGLIHLLNADQPSRRLVLEMFLLLINNLRKRNIIEKQKTDVRRVEIAPLVAKKVHAIATTSRPWPQKSGRFMVEVHKGLEEAPGAERWEEDLTRVSLANNNIKQLQLLLPRSHSSENAFSPLPRHPQCPNLSTLILTSNPTLWKIEDDFFKWTPNLRVLDLSMTGLLALPSSLSHLTNLRSLNLFQCTKLETLSPCIERGFQNLLLLDLGSCPLKGMTTASFRQMCNLQKLYVDDMSLQNLVALDLSNTKFDDLPLGLHEITSLTRLDLLNTKHLSAADWHTFTRLPAAINWDQCGSGSLLPESGGPRISVEEAGTFRWLSYHSPLWTQCFCEFYISVSPCTQQQKVRPTYFQRKHQPLPYTNVIPQIEQCLPQFRPPPTSHSKRHLQICGGTSRFNISMKGVLPHVESLYLSDHTTVDNILVSYPMELRQCQVHNCPSMETVFHGRPERGHVSRLSSLETMHLFHLTRLRTIYEGNIHAGSFAQLREVYIYSCPNIISVFSYPHIVLRQLRVLVIKLCGKLREVFGGGAMGQNIAPALSELCLWDLQDLRNISHGHLPSLRTLKLRGCAKLRTLPLPRVDSRGNPFKLEISAEHKWWKNLNEANKEYIIFKGQPP